VTIVKGSGAADLDSIVGSVCYAYLLDREGRLAGLISPYLPIPRKDLPLRSEAAYLFDKVGLQWENMMFADDVDLVELLGGREGELVLVDDQGNDLAPALRERIAEVIDHHRVFPPGEERMARDHPSGYLLEYPTGVSSNRPLRRRIVEPVGSACTLVAQQILQRKPEILDRQLAALLLAAVLLDTVNLDPKAGRATDKDREIAGLLIQAGSVNPTGLYDELVRARSDVGALSSNQLLGKDYKEGRAGAVRFGMSSVPLLLDFWKRRDRRLGEAFSGFLAEKELDLLVVLLYRHGDEFKRQLVFCGTEEKLVTCVVSHLTEPLGLAKISAATDEGEGSQEPRPAGGREAVIRTFTQRERNESRKQIEPRLREILKSL
jgi:exopolyphosphatase